MNNTLFALILLVLFMIIYNIGGSIEGLRRGLAHYWPLRWYGWFPYYSYPFFGYSATGKFGWSRKLGPVWNQPTRYPYYW